jgi:hypothetical protein
VRAFQVTEGFAVAGVITQNATVQSSAKQRLKTPLPWINADFLLVEGNELRKRNSPAQPSP